MRRVALAVCPGGGRPVSYFTFRPDGEGAMVEDRLVRGVHPMVGRRLNLWRLRDFDVTRLEAPEDVLLYHCVAKDNADDQRLVALAQVHRFEVARDPDGRITEIEGAETVLAACEERARTDGRKLLRDTLASALQTRADATDAPKKSATAARAGTPAGS